VNAPDDDARLTSYALGELSAEEAEAVERRLEGDPAARAVVEAVRAVAAAVAEASAEEGTPRLDAARRDEIRRAAAAAVASRAAPGVPSRASPPGPAKIAGGSMPKYQACPKCAAQFDVSAFAPGQKFTCGACGTVVTAGAGAPAVGGRVPGSVRVPAGGAASGVRGATSSVGQGPQYRPLERHQSREAAPPAAGTPRRERRERRARETDVDAPKKSNAPILVGAAALLLVAGGAAFFLLGKKDDANDAPKVVGGGGGTTPGTPGMGQAPTPEASSGDTLQAVEDDFKQKPEHTSKELASFLRRYKALGSEKAMARAREVADEIVKYADPKDSTQQAVISEAHLTLGHVEFKKEIPEVISYYNEPFIRAVQEANAQRWFGDKEQYELAMRAWRKTEAHAKRLEEDRVYALLTQEKARIARDDDFKNYNYATHFASPYLIFYSSEKEMSEFDLMKKPKVERVKELAELEDERRKWSMILAEKGKIYTQLYQHFLKTYGEECELKDLMAPYGGRPDYPASKRSFQDGVPLIIWIFSNREAFDYHHKKQLKDKDQSTGLENVAGYFSPRTGWVYLYDEANRQFEVDKNVHEGTHQLEYWFQRQKREWATEFRVPQSFFGEGFAEYIGSVEMDPDRNLKFIGWNRSRLRNWQGILKEAETSKKKPPVYPLEEFVKFEGYHEAQAYAASKLGVDPGYGLGVFYIQSWALVYFLNQYPEGKGKYRVQFNRYLNDILNYDEDVERYGWESFRKQFGLKTEADWKALDSEFKKFYLEDLKKVNVGGLAEKPPERDVWPGFVDPEEADPSNPEAPAAAGAPKEGDKPSGSDR
jgi:anti-sigma factor RsiW